VPASGVTIGAADFEWREVARDYHLTYQQFLELPVDEQARHIAHHRVRNRIEAVLAKDAIDKSKAKAGRK
jgi:hypothetical protein